MSTVTGPELRRERRLADVTATDVAAHMGISRQTLHVIEREAAPDPERVRQYREAVRTLSTGTEPAEIS